MCVFGWSDGRTTSLSLYLLLLCSIVASGCSPYEGQVVKRGGAQSDITIVKASNATMNDAFAEARRTLPRFIQALQHPRLDQQYVLKVRLADGKNTEYLWLRDLRYDGIKFHGSLEDDPYWVKGFHAGQEMTVSQTEVYDWIILKGGKVSDGNYTEPVIEKLTPHKP